MKECIEKVISKIQNHVSKKQAVCIAIVVATGLITWGGVHIAHKAKATDEHIEPIPPETPPSIETPKEELEPIESKEEEGEEYKAMLIGKEASDKFCEAAVYISKTVYGEARGCSDTQKAAVVWCILNRADKRNSEATAEDIIAVVTSPKQFHGYDPSNPDTDEIYDLVMDVIFRWQLEKAGVEDIGRVLPKDYLYFYGDGTRNHFTRDWKGNEVWDWRLQSPYED